MQAILFDNDDLAYQAWLKSHPDGWVVNMRRNLAPSYVVLHKAGCGSVSRYRPSAPFGGFTERSYVKICAMTREELIDWLGLNVEPGTQFSKECSLCAEQN